MSSLSRNLIPKRTEEIPEKANEKEVSPEDVEDFVRREGVEGEEELEEY